MGMVGESKLALLGGRPVRGRENPLPPLFPRRVPEAALRLVKEVLDGGFVTDHIGRLEQRFAALCGARFGVAVDNCTAAVHSAVAALSLSPGDEVITAPVTDYGTIAGILYQNALPVFADVDPVTGNVTAEAIQEKITGRTRAILVVHLYGLPCDMDGIAGVARKHAVTLIEDCCQAPLAEYRSQRVGTLGDMGTFSFDAEKHMPTDHGGMVVTDREELAENVRRFAIARGAVPCKARGMPYRVHSTLGLNYRMGNVLCAIGLATCEVLPEIVSTRQRLASILTGLVRELPGVRGPALPEGVTHSYWLYPLTLDLEVLGTDVYEFARALNAEGVPALPREYYLAYRYPFFQERKGTYGLSRCPFECRYTTSVPSYDPAEFPGAEQHVRQTLPLEWHEYFSEQDVRDIAEAIAKVANHFARSTGG